MKLSEYLLQIKEIPGLIAAIRAHIDKVQAEILKQVGDLQAQIANLQSQLADVEIPADAETTLGQIKDGAAGIEGQVQGIDDWNPDQP